MKTPHTRLQHMKSSGEEDWKEGEEPGYEVEKRQESKEEGKEGKGLSGQALVLRVQEYFYGDDELSLLFERFIADKSSCVDLDSEEYKLDYTAVYEEFKALFELKLSSFIEDTLGVSVEDFYEALQAKSREDEWGMEAVFAQILVGVTDFDVFMQMMREGKKGNKVSHK